MSSYKRWKWNSRACRLANARQRLSRLQIREHIQSEKSFFYEIRDGIGLFQFKKNVMLFIVNGAFYGFPQITTKGCNGA
jgi:hypothetical protein